MTRLLVLSGGHPYDADAFEALLAGLDGWTIDHRLHPAAEATIVDALAVADAVLFYDMPGYTFADGAVAVRPPSEAYRAAVTGWFANGGGAVAMHHALAGWAAWPEWAEIVGGRFLYQPDRVRGQARLDSGYRHDVAYDAEVVAPGHPVMTGLPPCFALADELYLAELFDDRVTPLLRARHAFVREDFFSAAHAVAGQMFKNSDWPHPPSSDLIAWETHPGNGRLVYLQPGDGPAAYSNAHFRRLLANALAYVAA